MVQNMWQTTAFQMQSSEINISFMGKIQILVQQSRVENDYAVNATNSGKH